MMSSVLRPIIELGPIRLISFNVVRLFLTLMTQNSNAKFSFVVVTIMPGYYDTLQEKQGSARNADSRLMNSG